MAVPEEIRKVERPVNTIVLDHGGNGIYRYAVLERTGCRRVGGSNRPVTGGTIGHIIDRKFGPCAAAPVSMSTVELKDYADAALIDSLGQDILQELCSVYDYKDALRIYCLAGLKVCYHGEPYKRLHLRYETSFFSEWYPSLAMSKNSICAFLNGIGSTYSRITAFMREHVRKSATGQDIIIDGTLKSDESCVNSLSHYSRKARTKGTRDITVLYAYGASDREPVCSKVYGGNVIDAVSFEDFLREMGLEYGIVLTDKGFPHSKVSEVYSKRPKLHYLSPLKRSDRRIEEHRLHDYDSMPAGDRDRDLLAKKVAVKGKNGGISYYLYSFYDRARASKEEADWFRHNKGKGFSNAELEDRKEKFGTVVFESDIDKDPMEIYRLYDSRWLVEEFFHYYKEEDDFDDTRVHLDASVYGSEFISFIASLLTARLVNRFDSLGLFKTASYKDIMTDLAQAKKIKSGEGDDKWLYVRLPEGIQDELRLLGLMEKKTEKAKGKPGRPKTEAVPIGPKRGRGRPLGSKNKPKTDAQNET